MARYFRCRTLQIPGYAGFVPVIAASGLASLLAFAPLPSRAEEIAKALMEITDTADRLCGNVATRGTTSGSQAAGEVKAELNGLVKRLADIGVSASGASNSTAYEGVVQQELTTALRDVRECKLKIFYTLQEKLLPSAPRPERPSPPADPPRPADRRSNILKSSTALCGQPVEYAINGAVAVESHRPFLGVWRGGMWNSRVCGGLIVQGIAPDGTAQVAYIYGPAGPQSSFPWRIQRPYGLVDSRQLSFRDEDGGRFTFQLSGADTLHGYFTDLRGNTLNTVFSRDPSSVPW